MAANLTPIGFSAAPRSLRPVLAQPPRGPARRAPIPWETHAQWHRPRKPYASVCLRGFLANPAGTGQRDETWRCKGRDLLKPRGPKGNRPKRGALAQAGISSKLGSSCWIPVAHCLIGVAGDSEIVSNEPLFANSISIGSVSRALTICNQWSGCSAPRT
jgi:hypothetical protein